MRSPPRSRVPASRGIVTHSHYYERWLAALEKLVAAKNVVREADMARRVDEWDTAARATPHGKPIQLHRDW